MRQLGLKDKRVGSDIVEAFAYGHREKGALSAKKIYSSPSTELH